MYCGDLCRRAVKADFDSWSISSPLPVGRWDHAEMGREDARF
jgi:hypothetical protein